MNVFRSTYDTSRNARNAGPPHFPIYLLPTLKIPFLKRRQSSAAATTASNDVPSLSSSPTSPTGSNDFPSSPTNILGAGTYALDLPQDKPPPRASHYHQQHQPKPRRGSDTGRLTRNLPDILRCNACGTDIAYGLQIVSKGFTGRHGRALLVSAPPTTTTPSCPGPPLSGPSPSPSTPSSSSSSSSSSSTTTTRGGGTSAPPPIPVNANSYSSLARDGTNLVNVVVGKPESRALVTGAHVVADISCAACDFKIGWKYVDAREQAQKYKVGKFILETERVVLHRSWEDVPAGEGEGEGGGARGHFYSSSAPAAASAVGDGGRKLSCSTEGGEGGCGSGESEEEVAFDSDDDDECEDIFAGVWDAATVAKRRGSRVGVGGLSRAARKKRAAGAHR